MIPEDRFLMIIGAMKSGTCYLYSLLSQHPEVCKCKIKEPEYFSERQFHGVKVKSYSDLWEFDNSVHRYVIEASTGYTKYPEEQNVPKNIKLYNLNPIFIYIVRNPFDRIESQFNFSRYIGFVNYSIPFDHEQYVSLSRYYYQLVHYMQYFSIENIIVIDFDDLINSPMDTLCRLCNKLEISDFDFNLDDSVTNSTPCKKRIEYMSNQYKTIGRLLDNIPQKVIPYFLQLPFLGSEIRYRMSRKQYKRVHTALKEDMKLLQMNFGINTEKWGF